jgi:hypothetical protein
LGNHNEKCGRMKDCGSGQFRIKNSVINVVMHSCNLSYTGGGGRRISVLYQLGQKLQTLSVK